jgi:hypothetical protein
MSTKIPNILLPVLLMTNLCSSCGSVGSHARNERQGEKVETNQTEQSKLGIVSELRENKIKAYGEWNTGEELPLIYMVEREDSGDHLLVQDSKGRVLYEKGDINVERIYTIYALRTISSQLVFEYGEGGNDSYVQMLAFTRNKVSERIDSANDANSFGSDIRIQPQFRTGINPAKEPFEIVLVDFGLASPAGKSSKVLRYDGIKYHFVGKFDRRKLDDYKEEILTKP